MVLQALQSSLRSTLWCRQPLLCLIQCGHHWRVSTWYSWLSFWNGLQGQTCTFWDRILQSLAWDFHLNPDFTACSFGLDLDTMVQDSGLNSDSLARDSKLNLDSTAVDFGLNSFGLYIFNSTAWYSGLGSNSTAQNSELNWTWLSV